MKTSDIAYEVIKRAMKRSAKWECPFDLALADELADIIYSVHAHLHDGVNPGAFHICETDQFRSTLREHVDSFLKP